MPLAPRSLPVDAFLAAAGPVVDVRSPAEFAQGHIPQARNLPLFDDVERAQVGSCYKQQGRQAAVLLGLALVGPKLQALSQQLISLAGPDQSLRLHCWRGGMRSSSVAWLAGCLDLAVLLLDGGYKAYRHWVLACFDAPLPLLLLGGRTGTGKSDLLAALSQRGAAVVDLEGLASHRGSSFGGLGMPPQPTSEQFENGLAAALRALEGRSPIWLEAESAQVGRCRIPAGLWRQMGKAPVVEIQRSQPERVGQLVAVYGRHGQEDLAAATARIARRLGPQRAAAALAAIGLSDWAGACNQMLDYYDRCYDHEQNRRPRPPLASFELTGLGPTAAADLLLNDRDWRHAAS
ncbi:MAG: tRNA 2-selenouridine(34) synthase MnmH [Synechococcus sp.]|jgi:tRNA 2-selenouridine synthase|nr:tRNA 2-selenouridine(34) synthase MnmH [Synechococcus sp.]